MSYDFFKDAREDFLKIEKLGIDLENFDISTCVDTNSFGGPHSGYKTKQPLKITNFGSSEATVFYLDIAKSFNFKPIGTKNKDIAYYRYCLSWYYDIIHQEEQDDYFHESIISLKRSIRFDFHPYVENLSPLEKEPHWHPNGCSELKTKTEILEPFEAVAFFSKFFAEDVFKGLDQNLQGKVNNIF